MTELRIDGVPVELPSDFSVAVKKENPFFTKSGEYTYDIELPLASSTNAQLYGFLQRWNTEKKVRLDRRAVLIADNRVYLDGTEVITGWTDTHVKIQLVSGNSEMNWLANEELLLEDLKIEDTNLDGIEPSDAFITETYPAAPFALPFVALADGSTINKWIYDSGSQRWKSSGSGFYAMPYLCQYLKNLIDALGYTLHSNVLAECWARHIILIHSQPTGEWGKFFPGMTVRDFLVSVERTFNVTILVDQHSRRVDILKNAEFFNSAALVHLNDVVDSYECELDEEEYEVLCDTSSYTLEYNLPSSEYYNQAQLAQYVKDVALRHDGMHHSYGEAFDNHAPDVTSNVIVQVLGELDPARFDYYYKLAGFQEDVAAWHYVDVFRSHTVGQGNTTVAMPMIPAEITCTDGHICVVAGDTPPRNDKYPKLDDILSKNAPDKGDAGTLRMALYTGLTKAFAGQLWSPVAFTDFTVQGEHEPARVMEIANGRTPTTLSLRPSEMAKTFYSDAAGSYTLDLNHAVRVVCYDKEYYDTSSVFVIHQRTYLCRDMEYIIDVHGRHTGWKGTFIPVRLGTVNDWILDTGAWNDRGVFVDDGEWNINRE